MAHEGSSLERDEPCEWGKYLLITEFAEFFALIIAIW